MSDPQPAPLAEKTFKIEFEITVRMDEVSTSHLSEQTSDTHLNELQDLQKALLDNDNILIDQMQIRALDLLQQYIDYLTGQNSLASLQQLSAQVTGLQNSDMNKAAGPAKSRPKKVPSDTAGFATYTRPLRVRSMSVSLNEANIYEKSNSEGAVTRWRAVWSDLMHKSELGRLLKRLPFPLLRTQFGPDHHLLVRYITRRPSGVHVEAACSCDASLEGIGEDECQAVEHLWDVFQRHYQSHTSGGSLLQTWRQMWDPSNHKS